MLGISNGRLHAYLKMQFGDMMRYAEAHPELKPYIHYCQAGSHRHIDIDGAPVKSTLFIHHSREWMSIEEFDAFYRTAMTEDAVALDTNKTAKRDHQDYFLVRFDDGQGNLDPEGKVPNGIIHYLKSKGFKCKSGYGYWGCPWYFIDIRNRIFLPGRPGVCYGEVVGNRSISFDEFKEIYSIYERYDTDEPILSTVKKEPIQAIIDTASYEERIALALFISQRFPSTKTTFFETEEHHKTFSLVVFDEGKAFGRIGVMVARDLSSKGFEHYVSVDAFIAAFSD